MITVRIFICCFCLNTLFACKNENEKKVNTINVSDTLPNKNPYVNIDQSPLDMSWYPTNYPIEKMKGNTSLKLIARLLYSRPHKKGRKIFGDDSTALCMYGKPWRLGANEASEIDFFENVIIAGKNINKGTYTIYCIPHDDRWTIVLNNDLYTWGLNIDEDKDLFRADLPTMPQLPIVEDFTMFFNDMQTGCTLTMAWDNVKVELPIVFAR